MSKTLLEQITTQLEEQNLDAPNWLADPDVELTEENLAELEALGVVLDEDEDDDQANNDNGDNANDGTITLTEEERVEYNKKYLGRGRRRAHKDAVEKMMSALGMTEQEARDVLKSGKKNGNTDPAPPTNPNPPGDDALEAERKALAAEKQRLQDERAEMQTKQVKQRAIAALTAAGAASPKRAVKLLELSDLDHESDDDEYADAVEELRDEMPNLFQPAKGQNNQRSGVSGNGRQSPRNPQPILTPAEKGQQRAAQRAKQRANVASPMERMGSKK